MMSNTVLMAGMLGGQELLILLLIVLVLFGGNKIASLGDGLGKGIKNFRRSLKDEDEDQAEVVDAEVVTDQRKASGAERIESEEG